MNEERSCSNALGCFLGGLMWLVVIGVGMSLGTLIYRLLVAGWQKVTED